MATNTNTTTRTKALAGFREAEKEAHALMAQMELELANHHMMAHKEKMPEWIEHYTGQLRELCDALEPLVDNALN